MSFSSIINAHIRLVFLIAFIFPVVKAQRDPFGSISHQITHAELYFNVAAVKDKDARDELIEMFNELNALVVRENLKIQAAIDSLKTRDFVGSDTVRVMQHLKDNKVYLCRTSNGNVYHMTFLTEQSIPDGSAVESYIKSTDDFYEYKTVLGANKRVSKYVEIPSIEISAINIRKRSEEREENPELYTLKELLSREEFLNNLKKGDTYEGSSSVPVRCTEQSCTGGIIMYEDYRARCKSCVKGRVTKTIKVKMIWDKTNGKLKWIKTTGTSYKNVQFLLD